MKKLLQVCHYVWQWSWPWLSMMGLILAYSLHTSFAWHH